MGPAPKSSLDPFRREAWRTPSYPPNFCESSPLLKKFDGRSRPSPPAWMHLAAPGCNCAARAVAEVLPLAPCRARDVVPPAKSTSTSSTNRNWSFNLSIQNLGAWFLLWPRKVAARSLKPAQKRKSRREFDKRANFETEN